jgi:Leucine-rich repeat (LRR) protein
MADAVLSAFLQALFDGMASPEFVDFFRQRKLNEGVLEKLKIALLSVHKLREDAEDKQLTDRSVGEWLSKLKDVVYDAEDVLDEIATEALQRKLDAEFQTTASKVRNSISTFFSHFVKDIEPKIKELLDKLEYLASQKDVLGLKQGVGGESSKRLPTTSLVEESGIFGRDDDKEKIISLLIPENATGNENLCVIPIVGMGGIGKTTLAQLVYKDNSVKEHFDLQAWVCVSDEFDVFMVTKTVLEAVTLSACDMKDLNMLQVTLQEKLMGKKFLLVLDDVWNENYADWEALSSPFKSGARGSTVIVTTRNDSVASIMRAVPTDRLKPLLEEDCWSLFVKHAFHDGNFDAGSELEVIGRQIVKKCEGLPLAAKAIGSLLRSKLGVDEWEKILKSELWDSPIDKTNILPALRLSYKYLPSHLKQCFAYCSIFPKDHVFKKDEVVLLWMAEGFLEETKNKRMEEVGEDYFLALASRSLLEQSSGNKSGFVMHDLVNDLAKFVSGQFTFRLEVDNSHEIVNKTRHFSYFRRGFGHDNFKRFEALYEATRLHTFLPLELSPDLGYFFLTKRVPLDLLPKLRCLRVLSLSHYHNITELPKSIGKIRHLRYLNLSFTAIKSLRNSICKLCNLQTLNLSGCEDLAKLPRDMRKLINLRHLNISGTAIKEMPMQLSRLKCLQTLTKFIISKHSGACIEELGKLVNLRGKLSVLDIQNVVSPTVALKTCLKDRKYFEELVLEWNAFDTNLSECQRSVLENLQPHSNLKSLTINGYDAESLPDWVGHQSFSNIASLCLENCKHCHNLPPLGQLLSLQELSVVGFEGVVKVDTEFYGSNFSSIKPFGALKVLRFEKMLKWEEWSSFGTENEGGAFPQLEELYIYDCPKLIGGLPIHLSSLAKLEIHHCPLLVASLATAPVLRELQLKYCNEVLLKELPTGLRELNIGGFDALESLPEGLVDSIGCIQHLKISNCLKLELPTHPDFSSLETLWLYNCDSLRSFPLDLFPKLYRIKISVCKNMESFTVLEHGRDLVTLRIEISVCSNFVSFPKGGIRAPDLSSFLVNNCASLRSLPDKMHILLPSLQSFRIIDCPRVESFPQGGLPSNVESILVERCEKLFAGRLGWGLQNLSSVRCFSFDGVYEDMESFPEPGFLPSCLTQLHIIGFPNMKSLNKKGLQHLTSLQQLSMCECPKVEYMPKEGLPASLSIIEIERCPLLRKQWLSKKGKERQKIPNVDHILIDYEEYIG